MGASPYYEKLMHVAVKGVNHCGISACAAPQNIPRDQTFEPGVPLRIEGRPVTVDRLTV
jgi:hypothetical protein